MDEKTKDLDLEMLTLKDVCRILKVSRKTAYRILSQWGVRFLRHGHFFRVYRIDFERALSEKTVRW
ncbi:MAG: helix-turn-helix domain-containing protein [Planctomycetia bacterium]|nr:helix-turn-helix domain-containing protein [Planctomycetia bacterium]